MNVLHEDEDCPTRLMFLCPGCDEPHCVVIKRETPGGPEWLWNLSQEKPTFHPSILCHHMGQDDYRCHSFVTDGRIRFLDDCSHALAGQTVDLP